MENFKSFINEVMEGGCDVSSDDTLTKTCKEKEIKYYKKMVKRPALEQDKELERLEEVVGGSMSKESKHWFIQRRNILKQIVDNRKA